MLYTNSAIHKSWCKLLTTANRSRSPLQIVEEARMMVIARRRNSNKLGNETDKCLT